MCIRDSLCVVAALEKQIINRSGKDGQPYGRRDGNQHGKTDGKACLGDNRDVYKRQVYNIMLILSSYSLPLAVSKMVSARMAKGQYRNAVRVLKAALRCV